VYLDDIAERIILLAKTSITTSLGNIPDGEAHGTFVCERFPYFTLLTGAGQVTGRDSDTEQREHNFLLKLHVAKQLGDLDAAKERRMRDWIATILNFYSRHPTLRRTATETGDVADSGLEALAVEGAQITGHTQPAVVPHGAGSEVIVGFNVLVPCDLWL